MELQELGGTNIRIPQIGIGMWRFRDHLEIITKAVELGARLIDTARSYGNEELVGEAIKGMRKDVFIATKTHHFRYEEVMGSAEESLRRLGVEQIDLYQLHWPSAVVPIEETMGAMEDLVDQGKVRFIGLSNFTVPELKKAQGAVRKHQIVSNQVRYSLIERTIERDVLPHCQRHQITVIAYSPLGSDYIKLRAADSDDLLGRIGECHQKTRAQVALNWCISKPGLVVIPKTESMQHLEENCQSSGWQLTDAELRLLDQKIRCRRRSRLEVALRRRVRGIRERLRGN